MDQSSSASDKILDPDQRDFYQTLHAQLRVMWQGLNVFASEFFIGEDSGLMTQDVRRLISRDLNDLAYDIGVFARDPDLEEDWPGEADEQDSPSGRPG